MLHQIGSGVLGPVFRTYDPQRDRLIAVKAFRLDLVPEDVARLADALRRLAAASPTHPNLVPAVDAGLEGATAFLAMEYVAGETLDVAFRHLAPAPLDRALPVIADIANALEAGWAVGLGQGALHPRDVFLLAGTNEVRVTGVGVVPALEATGIKAPVRRPYTAPERAANEAWDIRADVYSLGVIAHELLTRRRPGGTGEQDGALATGLTPEQRVHVRRVLSAALAERPEHRFATPRAFADALAAVARGETPVLPPEPEGIAALPSERAARKRGLAATPLLEVIEPLNAPPGATVSERDLRSEAASDLKPLMPVAGESHATPTDAPLAHFESEQPRTVPPLEEPAPAPREAERRAPAPIEHIEPIAPVVIAAAPVDSPSRPIDEPAGAHATIRPEPFTARARSVPPPSFLTPTPETPSFPWLALGVVAAAGIVLGAVGGYQVGRSQAVPASTAPAAGTTVKPAADTEVRLPPEPVTTPVPEPVKTHPAPPPGTERAGAPEPPATNRPAGSRQAPLFGTIVVKSSPSGALVTVDSHPHGTTPATVRELSLGISYTSGGASGLRAQFADGRADRSPALARDDRRTPAERRRPSGGGIAGRVDVCGHASPRGTGDD